MCLPFQYLTKTKPIHKKSVHIGQFITVIADTGSSDGKRLRWWMGAYTSYFTAINVFITVLTQSFSTLTKCFGCLTLLIP